MKLPYKDISRNKKLENIVFTAILVIIYRLIFPSGSSLLIYTGSEIILFALLYTAALYINDFFSLKKYSPLSVILNVGLLTAILFFVFAISKVEDPGQLQDRKSTRLNSSH